MDLIAVVSCPSRRPQYLLRTLEGADREGGRGLCDKYLLTDGPVVSSQESRPSPEHVATVKSALHYSLVGGFWQFHPLEGPEGTRSTLWRSFDLALELGADRMLRLEDDLDFAEGAVTEMLATVVPDDCAFVTFCDWKEFPDPKYPAGLHVVPAMGGDGRGLHGAQALLFPRQVLEWLSARGVPADSPWEGPHQGDVTLSWALRESPWPAFAVRLPSLVDHVGFESAAGARLRTLIRPALSRSAVQFARSPESPYTHERKRPW